jgi:GMP synthase (glutamine-hydrolysing)
MDTMRVLVLQARRSDDPMMAHEQRCFVASTGLAAEDLTFINLPDRVPTRDDLHRYDALMVGGAGHYSVVEENAEFFPAAYELLRQVASDGLPTFASCFGFQLFVVALGGRVIHDPDNTEVGGYRLRLTEDGRRDSLLGTLPVEFVAQMGHMDRAVEMPSGVANLAASDRSPLQALRIPNRPVWATQFHPELDQQSNHERYRAYIERYDPGALDEQEESCFQSGPSPEVSTLLPAFLDLLRDR